MYIWKVLVTFQWWMSGIRRLWKKEKRLFSEIPSVHHLLLAPTTSRFLSLLCPDKFKSLVCHGRRLIVLSVYNWGLGARVRL
jgi:hypothetical protein